MKLILEHTEQFFTTDDGFPVRAWTGTTGRGTRVIAFIAAICAPADEPQDELERELHEIPGPATSGAAERTSD